MRYKVWEAIKYLVRSNVLLGALMIYMCLMSSMGYYKYISSYFILTFDQWQKILEIREDAVYLLVRFHVIVMMVIVFMSGFSGLFSGLVYMQSKGKNMVREVMFFTTVTFILLILAVGVQLYFEDPYVLLKHFMDVSQL